jgi:hypothetical protein
MSIGTAFGRIAGTEAAQAARSAEAARSPRESSGVLSAEN